MRLVLFVLLGALQPGCQRCSKAPEGEAHKAPAAAPSVTSSPVVAARKAALMASADRVRSPAAARVVAIGDLHGDLKATRRAFKLAGATDDKDNWIGGQLVVVQTGDVLDRGNDEAELLAFLSREEAAAENAGGHLMRLNGNHEVMNVQGDFRYVTERGFAVFAGEPTTGRPDLEQFPVQQRGRAAAFLPGGRQARKLAAYPVVWIVGDTVFAHGGVMPAHVRYGLERMNHEISVWMRGESPLPKQLQGDKTPFWIRDYGEGADEQTCKKLDTVLKLLKATRMVVGHTPQKSGITFECDRHLARIDVGLSAYYGANPTEVLEIVGEDMRVLRANAPPSSDAGPK